MSPDEEIEAQRRVLEVQQAEMRSIKPNASVYRQLVNNSHVFYLTTRQDINTHLKERGKKLQAAETKA